MQSLGLGTQAQAQALAEELKLKQMNTENIYTIHMDQKQMFA